MKLTIRERKIVLNALSLMDEYTTEIDNLYGKLSKEIEVVE